MNTTFDSIINEISAYDWVCTYATAMQYCAELDEYTYAYIQAVGEEVFFDTIDGRSLFETAKKTAETGVILSSYGYKYLKDLESEYDKAWLQMLIKFVFETKMTEKPPLFIGAEDECEQLVAKVTGCSIGIPA